MNSKFDSLLNIIISIFLATSSGIAVIWIINYSGIRWTPDEFAMSLWISLLEMAKKWGPLFVPAASVIFVAKTFQRNVSYEVCAMLESKLQHIIAHAVTKAISDSLDKRIAEKTLLGIRSIYRGVVGGYSNGNPDLSKMYEKSSRDFCEATGLPHLDIPAHP